MADDINKLTWETQIEYLKDKLLSSIVVIKRSRKFIPEFKYLGLYNSLFKSHISYCIISCDGISNVNYKLIFIKNDVSDLYLEMN